MASFIFIAVSFSMLLSPVRSASLVFILQQSKTECFYSDKTEGQTIDTMFQLGSNSKVDFAIFGPDNNLIEQQKKVEMIESKHVVEKSGAYAFCFSGRNLLSDTTVMFDYDMDVEKQKESSAETKFSQEKVDFLKGAKTLYQSTDNYKNKVNLTVQFMMDVVRNSRDELNENSENKVVENSLLYISILGDRMIKYLKDHKVKQYYHFNVQEWNLFSVDMFSIIISGGMLISACAQLIVIKSFFTGSLSWKIWQF